MSHVILAKRYINAFIKNVVKEKLVYALDQVELMGCEIMHQDDLLKVLFNPVITYDQKKKLLVAVAKELSVDMLVLNLYSLLLKKKRLLIIGYLVQEVKEIKAQISGLSEVVLSVPNVFNESDLPHIKKMIELRLGKKVFFSVQERDECIAGFKAQAGFILFDGTLENHLNKFAFSLT